MRGGGGRDDLLPGGLRDSVRDVLRDGAAEQPGVLQHHADACPQLLSRHRGDVDPVQCDPAAGDIVEPHQEIDQRGLPGAGRADDRDGVTGFRGQRQVLDQRPVRGVAKGDVLEGHPATQPLRVRRGDRVRFLLAGVKKVEHPLRGGHPGLHQVRHAGDHGQRLAELPGVLDERLHVTDRQCAGRDPQSPDDRDQHVVEVPDKHHRRLHQSGDELRAPADRIEPLVVLPEDPRGLLLPAKRPDQRVPGVHLLNVRVEPASDLPLADELRLRELPDPRRDHDRNRHCDQRDQGERPGDPDHHRQHADDGQQRDDYL